MRAESLHRVLWIFAAIFLLQVFAARAGQPSSIQVEFHGFEHGLVAGIADEAVGRLEGGLVHGPGGRDPLARLAMAPPVLEQGQQGPDHPVHPAIPETDYLKVILARVLPV